MMELFFFGGALAGVGLSYGFGLVAYGIYNGLREHLLHGIVVSVLMVAMLLYGGFMVSECLDDWEGGDWDKRPRWHERDSGSGSGANGYAG